jgi:thiol-disulfide isomerase/thioredoxin
MVFSLVLFGLLAIGLVILMIWRGRETVPGGTKHVAVGRRLTTIELEPLTGAAKPIRAADLRGKIVLMNYWGTWCPPCRIEYPRLLKVYNRLQDQEDFSFISVSCGPGAIASDGFQEDIEDLQSKTLVFLNYSEIELPAQVDRFGSTRLAIQIVSELESFLYPTTVVLDRDEIIRGVWHGFEPGMEDDIESLLWKLLKE